MRDSRKVVYAGLATNIAIALSKLVLAAATGSSAMLAEGLHSIVDTGNSLLLLLGMHRSRRPPHPLHPFGHGLELYFWSFVVAVSMFAVGGVLSIWEGVSHLLRPQSLNHSMWDYVVLGVSIAISCVSLVIAMREINRRKGDAGIVEFIRRSKDPTVFTVVLEDASDIIGAAIAMLSIFLSMEFRNPRLDAAGSILVGFVILAVSFVLANESRELLLGEAAPARDVERMKQLLASDPGVERVGDLLTMQLGPNEVLLNVEIDFKSHHAIEDLERTIDRLESSIREHYPEVRRLYIEAESLQEHDGNIRKAS